MKTRLFVMALVMCAAVPAMGQSSSLYLRGADDAPRPAHQAPRTTSRPVETSQLSAAIAESSFMAVPVPEPRQFAVQDLVTIIIREAGEADFEATLETEKESGYDGEISDFPNLELRDLLNLQLEPSDMDEGNPKLGVDFNREFAGDGEYRRRESITGRVTARVVDVKPNGNLVLEARRVMTSDEEELEVVLTGTCRAEDVSVDNTVLSSEMYDLQLSRQHAGDLRKSTKKGIFTRVLDAIFNF
ncbi:MAG: flagellar basal body L-ring protein FlgH [Phycisphaeraceae bacterium]